MRIQSLQLADPLWNKILQKLPHDIYHLPDYVEIEAKRLNATAQACAIAEGDHLFFLPYLLRSCHEIAPELGGWDVISPYGYPGILASDIEGEKSDFISRAWNKLLAEWQQQGICSAFLRLNPLLDRGISASLPPDSCPIDGTTVSIDLQHSEAELWHQTRPEHRNKINRLKRSGFQAKTLPLAECIEDFMAIYYATMDRVGASATYYFDRDYFTQLAQLHNNISTCIVTADNRLACAGIFTECSSIVQYHLGGTHPDFFRQAPSKLMFDYVRSWAKSRGNRVFHLGGGLGGGNDSLFQFKAGFSKQRHPFRTVRAIVDPERYHQLVNFRATILEVQAEDLLTSGFFPAYRASITR
jgi:Acetyltransferase (GNAT) domain